MTNFLDCPREIRDLIYASYFASTLTINPQAPLHSHLLLHTSHSIAAEASEAAVRALDAAIETTKHELRHLEASRACAAPEAEEFVIDHAAMTCTVRPVFLQDRWIAELRERLAVQQAVVETLEGRSRRHTRVGREDRISG